MDFAQSYNKSLIILLFIYKIEYIVYIVRLFFESNSIIDMCLCQDKSFFRDCFDRKVALWYTRL